jgi:hypothetical protein
MNKRTIAAPAKPLTVSNDVAGTILHLGDGRKLAFGETAEVTAEVKALFGVSRG